MGEPDSPLKALIILFQNVVHFDAKGGVWLTLKGLNKPILEKLHSLEVLETIAVWGGVLVESSPQQLDHIYNFFRLRKKFGIDDMMFPGQPQRNAFNSLLDKDLHLDELPHDVAATVLAFTFETRDGRERAVRKWFDLPLDGALSEDQFLSISLKSSLDTYLVAELAAHNNVLPHFQFTDPHAKSGKSVVGYGLWYPVTPLTVIQRVIMPRVQHPESKTTLMCTVRMFGVHPISLPISLGDSSAFALRKTDATHLAEMEQARQKWVGQEPISGSYSGLFIQAHAQPNCPQVMSYGFIQSEVVVDSYLELPVEDADKHLGSPMFQRQRSGHPNIFSPLEIAQQQRAMQQAIQLGTPYDLEGQKHPDPTEDELEIGNDVPDSVWSCQGNLLPLLRAFLLREKFYAYLDPTGFKETKAEPTALNKVYLPAGWAELLTKLSTSKDVRLVILATGSTGVGKTMTAEMLAQLQGRPLYRVTAADLQTELEYSLMHRVVKWGAVVLVDEAEVFGPSRHQPMMERSPTPHFLRFLDQAPSLVMLTTNSPEALDFAVQSRITIHLPYPPLDPKARKFVWDQELKSKPPAHHRAKLEALELDGRQIQKLAQVLNVVGWDWLERPEFVELICQRFKSAPPAQQAAQQAGEFMNRLNDAQQSVVKHTTVQTEVLTKLLREMVSTKKFKSKPKSKPKPKRKR